MTNISRQLAAELLGSALLADTVIGSGILALAVSSGNDGVALLGNTLATAAMLYVLITILGPLSGAHFNPAVTLVVCLRGRLTAIEGLMYAVAQVVGCMLGAALAHSMFGLPLVQLSTHARPGLAIAAADGVATFALLFAILGGLRSRPEAVPLLVALIITAGYWWTSSTSFANPAITIARSFSDSFAGIRGQDVPGFIVAQFIGALAGHWADRLLFGKDVR